MITAYLANQLGFASIFKPTLDNIRNQLELIDLTVYEPFREASIYKDDIIKANNTDSIKEQVILWNDLDDKIGNLNNELMNKSDCLIALLDGGHTIDDGVSSEIGHYATLKRGPVFALRTDFRLTENVGTSINLQVLKYIKESKGELIDYKTYGDYCMSKFFETIKKWLEQKKEITK
ncbi:MAG TPA: nucleoside 2-deoxyribosyltransferase [Candidatus Nanoarchaeia archaeon]|nr:nucleoside 2-deoxyribosyltransferase [Candidatus Nanoarchaeia archaeon]